MSHVFAATYSSTDVGMELTEWISTWVPLEVWFDLVNVSLLLRLLCISSVLLPDLS